MNINYYALAFGTVLIILFSWFLSIRYRRFHGIARFFAFESILILFLLNYRYWFQNPFCLRQLISWVLLLLSIYVVIDGYFTLTRNGKPDRNFENTSVLVKSGIYKYIRHPLYLSVFLLGTGIMLKETDTIRIILGLVNMIAVYITSRIEEAEMLAKFGDSYRQYMSESRMFIPFVF
jgi:protein-S-isoprenylcysteine O-methyltransferase Ste14